MNQILLASILLISLHVNAQSFEPGLWKSKESLELNGIPLPTSSDEECITKDQAKDAKATIERELKRKGCLVTKWAFKNQRLDAAIKCDNNDMEATGKLSGPITSKSYELKGEAKGTYKQLLPAVAQLELTGQRVSACTK